MLECLSLDAAARFADLPGVTAEMPRAAR